MLSHIKFHFVRSQVDPFIGLSHGRIMHHVDPSMIHFGNASFVVAAVALIVMRPQKLIYIPLFPHTECSTIALG